MHKSESGLENERRKILKDFDIQRFYQTLAKRLDLMLEMKKRICHLVVKNERKGKDRKILGSCQRAEKLWNIKVASVKTGIKKMCK